MFKPSLQLDAAQLRSTAALTNLTTGERRPSRSARSGRCPAVSLVPPDRQRASAGRRVGRNRSVFMGEDADAANKEISDIWNLIGDLGIFR